MYGGLRAGLNRDLYAEGQSAASCRKGLVVKESDARHKRFRCGVVVQVLLTSQTQRADIGVYTVVRILGTWIDKCSDASPVLQCFEKTETRWRRAGHQ